MNNLQEAYLTIYQEALDPEERELRRAEIADKKAGRMNSKVAKKYSDSESKSAEREDKKSKGKHIHGMADSVELDGDLVDEAKVDKKLPEYKRSAARTERYGNPHGSVGSGPQRDRRSEHEARRGVKKEDAELEEKKGLWDNIHAKRKRGESPAKPGEKGYPKTLNVEELDQIIEGIRQARKNVGASKCWTGKKLGSPSTKIKGGKEVPNCVPEETVLERQLDPTETAEKERIVKGMKKSAAGFKERYGKRAKKVMYATATARAKERMDTSKSDRRYGVEG